MQITPAKPVIEKDKQIIFTKTTGLLNYKNEAASENDFKRQLLMLFMYSKTGPVIAKADINKDGLEDLFISGDKNNPGKMYIQKAGGKFLRSMVYLYWE